MIIDNIFHIPLYRFLFLNSRFVTMYVRILCAGATLDPLLWRIPNKGLSLARALSLSLSLQQQVSEYRIMVAAVRPQREKEREQRNRTQPF